MKAIHSVIETLEREIEELEKSKVYFSPNYKSTSTFRFYGKVENNIIGKVVYQNEPYNSVEEIDAKIQKKRKAIQALKDHLNS